MNSVMAQGLVCRDRGFRGESAVQPGGGVMQQRRNGRVHWQMSQVPYRAVHRTVLRGAERVWHDLRFKDLHRSSKEFELMERAMGFAALAMLTVFPLLVVVAAASAATHHGIAVWVVYGMGLTGPSARAVVQVFSAPAKVLSTTSFFSLLLLGVFGVTFAGSVQAGFERIWGLPAGPWHKIWRQAVWVTFFIAYIYAAATVGAVTRHTPAETVSRVSVAWRPVVRALVPRRLVSDLGRKPPGPQAARCLTSLLRAEPAAPPARSTGSRTGASNVCLHSTSGKDTRNAERQRHLRGDAVSRQAASGWGANDRE
jgi:hypothetical protein